MSQFLINTPAANDFMGLAATDTGCRAFLGDADSCDAHVGPDITLAQITLRDSALKVAALVQDPTRTEVQKHEAAQQLAERTVAQLAKTAAAIEARAEWLHAQGAAQAESQFAPSTARGSLDSEIRSWIRKQAERTDGLGLAKIRAATVADRDVAAVVFHSPSFLLNLNEANHTTLRFEATSRHLPDAYKMMTDGVALRELAPKYKKAISSIRSSFYNGAIAAQASRRVVV